MSRSRRHTPIFASTTCKSDKEDKTLARRRWRKACKAALNKGSETFPTLRDVSDVWSFGKDGKGWWKDASEKMMRRK